MLKQFPRMIQGSICMKCSDVLVYIEQITMSPKRARSVLRQGDCHNRSASRFLHPCMLSSDNCKRNYVYRRNISLEQSPFLPSYHHYHPQLLLLPLTTPPPPQHDGRDAPIARRPGLSRSLIAASSSSTRPAVASATSSAQEIKHSWHRCPQGRSQSCPSS